MRHLPIRLVFVATYVLIAFRRIPALPIGRPASALAGACFMVALATIDPQWGLGAKEAFAAVEPNTIGLSLGMMRVGLPVTIASMIAAVGCLLLMT